MELLPFAFHLWPSYAQATTLFLGTFILEDVAAIGAGLLLAAGTLGWATAFWPCFLGIWLGDAGLYAVARYGGREWFERSRFKSSADRVARSERWFARYGSAILVFSRLVPGARLPTYLAAGFLRVPLKRFLLVTGAASLVWTIVVLLLTQAVGEAAVAWVRRWQHGALAIVAAILGAYLLVRLLKRIDWPRVKGDVSAWLGRWVRWEFWPGWLFYPPVALHCLRLGWKYGGFTLPTAANPGIFSSGLVGESKHAILRELGAKSPEFTAEAELLAGTTAEERLVSLREICLRRNIEYPFVLKPDLGQRGAGVKVIRDEEQAREYLRQTNATLLVQRHAPGPHEVGIFYYRFPNETHGRIFAVTEKIFPVIVGDGHSTIAELIRRDARARFIAAKYLERFARRTDEKLAAGEELRLVQAGNHAQGCIFRNGLRLITPELTARIDEISRRLNGFYIGRYDIRYASESDLRAGKNFQIIELNGAAAEATNIYDARNTLSAAYRTLFQQWELVFAIGAANRSRGAQPMKPLDIWRAWRGFCRAAQTYPIAD
ncbi:MAG: VTT domain-containing protein [Verrucomicrobiota bacterium]